MSNGASTSLLSSGDVTPQLANAVLYAYLPGPQGGWAIASALFGYSSVSGRLPFTYPKIKADKGGSVVYRYFPYWHLTPKSEWSPPTFSSAIRQAPGHTSAPNSSPNPALYDFSLWFGYGNSYTSWTYSNVRIIPDTLTSPDQVATLYVTVTNNGMIGQTTSGHDYHSLLVFKQMTSCVDKHSSEGCILKDDCTRDCLLPDSKRTPQLMAFDKLKISRHGGSQTYRFSITPRKDLAFWQCQTGKLCERYLQNTVYTLYIGRCSPDVSNCTHNKLHVTSVEIRYNGGARCGVDGCKL